MAHLAAHGAYESQSDVQRILQTNVVGTFNLLAASVKVGVSAFVSAGSSSEYGFKTEPMRETDRLEPNSFYAVAKAAQTHLCSHVAGREQMGIGVFRLLAVYGPWEGPRRLIPTILRRTRAGLPLEMVAPDVARDFIFIDDVIETLLNFGAVSQLRGAVINLGTGRRRRWRSRDGDTRTVWQRLRCAGAAWRRRWDDAAGRRSGKKKRLLGWSRHAFRDSLAKTAAWMASTGTLAA